MILKEQFIIFTFIHKFSCQADQKKISILGKSHENFFSLRKFSSIVRERIQTEGYNTMFVKSML